MSQILELAIDCRDLGKRFGAVAAVDRLNFQVGRGEIFGLLGPDGAGKTTTIRMLCGIMPPSDGDATVLGSSVRRKPEAIKPRIGYMSQRFGLYDDLTVRENLEFSADLHLVPYADRVERLKELLAASRLAKFEKRLAQNLSGGMKQKLALACALVHTPELLFLDEPTTGVDPVSRRDFWEILYELSSQGVTLLVSTPYMDEAERCSRIGLMHDGRLLLCDTPEGIRRRGNSAIVEVRTESPWEVRRFLRSLDFVQSATAFGDRIHVALSAQGLEGRLQQTLEAAGLPVGVVRQASPNLEDVFIALMQDTSHASGY